MLFSLLRVSINDYEKNTFIYHITSEFTDILCQIIEGRGNRDCRTPWCKCFGSRKYHCFCRLCISA